MNGIGVFTWFGYVLSMAQKLELIKNAGFSSIMGWFGPEYSELDGDYMKLAEIASGYSLSVENCHLPYFETDSLWLDSLDGMDVFSQRLEDIKKASSCGINCLVFHPFGTVYPKEGGIEALFSDRLMRLGDAADKHEVRLAVENLFDNDTFTRLLDRAGHRYVGLCFDSGHNNVAEPNQELSLIKKYAGRLFALHMHDNNALADEHLLPFEGTIDWLRLSQLIDNSVYSGSFTCEAAYPVQLGQEGDIIEPDAAASDYLAGMAEACHKALSL
ncbi:MAG: sugar phosphate isomerase/epimerase [Eubacteriaceae bacterium]|nr:sugar phosphate isomerase/epimerase [Eubacteriaceae bacterium]